MEKLGPLDEGFHPAFFEEIDYCYRARRAGFRIVYQPTAVSYHYETTTLPPDSYERASAFQRNRIRFVLRNWDVAALSRFTASEVTTIQSELSLNEVIARARGYWDNMLGLPMIALERQRDSTLGGPLTRGNFEWLLFTLQTLRTESHRRMESLLVEPLAGQMKSAIAADKPNIANPRVTSPMFDQSSFNQIANLLSALEISMPLKEPMMNSRVPIVGFLINGFRRLCYALVLRSYLLPIMNQQTLFNQHARDAVAILAQANESQAHLFAEQLRLLSDQSLELKRALEMESQLNTITERELKLQSERNAALLKIQEILSADQAAVPHALMKLMDHVESRR